MNMKRSYGKIAAAAAVIGYLGFVSVFAADARADAWPSKRTPISGGTVPAELESVPAGYEAPSERPGRLEKLVYQTWESFTYDEKSRRLTKEAWVYVPYGYSEDRRYNVLYLSHGGWSDETSLMGTDTDPRPFKRIVDHAIADGKFDPLLIVLPTYNNTSPEDSGDYGLAIRLTNNFHNELVNDLIPAVESRYSTYADDVTREGLAASRDHRAFGGFSMGSVNTWRTFQYALDCFRYFMPLSGNISNDGELLAAVVRESDYAPDDFFIFTASGTADFAYAAFKQQVMTMGNVDGGIFRFADNERDGNLAFREKAGYEHTYQAANEYTYNGLRFFWSRASGPESSAAEPVRVTVGTETLRGFLQDNSLESEFGPIHFSSYIPESYTGDEPYALFITLPGWEGLYFQGVGANMVEDFGPEAVRYNDRMIVLSPQLDDWSERSAEMTIALTEYFLSAFNVDPEKVFLHGMSGGGETGSLVMGLRPELYSAYLMTASKWVGDLEKLAAAETPVYLAIGEEDSYYGSASMKRAYETLRSIYTAKGKTEVEISRLLKLDVKVGSYFIERGYQDQHMGAQAFAHDASVMGWLFGDH